MKVIYFLQKKNREFALIINKLALWNTNIHIGLKK